MAPKSPRPSTSSPLSEREPISGLSLAFLPPLYILPTHFSNDELFLVEEELTDHQAPITYDVREAKIFLTKIAKEKRAALELRSKGLWTEATSFGSIDHASVPPPQKKRRLSRDSTSTDDDSTSTDVESTMPSIDTPLAFQNRKQQETPPVIPKLGDKILVANVDWALQSGKSGIMLPIEPFIVYIGREIPRPAGAAPAQPFRKPVTYIRATSDIPSFQPSGSSGLSEKQFPSILSSTQADAAGIHKTGHRNPYNQRRRFGDRSTLPIKQHGPPQLHRTTTSEFEATEDLSFPEPPEWVKNHEAYACKRSTFADPPNSAFISELQKIKLARILTLDEIGERAYATSIASIAAYPYSISHPSEILKLPGCDTKIAALWAEWKDSGDNDSERYVPITRQLDEDEDLKVLKLFYNIWGVGAETARKFYFTKGWKELDDIVEFGWNELTRVQQIGVKYYDEFLIPIPRSEVESIANTILSHSRSCRNIPKSAYGTDADIEVIIVGGYRRGKTSSGDVDVIISHRDEAMTQDLVIDIISSLEHSGYITHTLTLHTTTSDRGQQTLPYRSGHAGHGFDSLDKGLCVWQDPDFLDPSTGTKTSTPAEKTKTGLKNPNVHRRVDIIISPWRTVGCAVLGWSGATTFERDIRRWAKKEKGWKFDSSGVRSRSTGQVIDLEAEGKTWQERERLVMQGLGIDWRPPEERWTG